MTINFFLNNVLTQQAVTKQRESTGTWEHNAVSKYNYKYMKNNKTSCKIK
jgi:hypothetical protein